jgi:hypothetical protein
MKLPKTKDRRTRLDHLTNRTVGDSKGMSFVAKPEKGLAVILLILILSSSLSTCRGQTPQAPRIKEVAITIIVYEDTFEAFTQWIQPYPYFHNFTFLLNPDHGYSWALANQTRLDFLTSLGELVPAVYFAIQKNMPEERKTILDKILNEWKNYTHQVPEGVFMHQPDTYSLNYLRSQGVNYTMGYCFDQYNVDFMTERGGWQLPYYASSRHALAPENQTAGGMLVLPWLTWDWIDSFTLSHMFQSETWQCAKSSNSSQYVIDLLETNANACQPFSYGAFSFDFDWYYGNGAIHNATKVLNHLLASPYTKMSCGNFSKWFKAAYPDTPTYNVDFTSPNSGTQIEWFYSQTYRIAKVNGQIVSFVEYGRQQIDPYYSAAAQINWTKEAGDPENCIDNSLNFTVDALGGGVFRPLPKDSPIWFDGLIENFPIYYCTPITPEFGFTPIVLVLGLLVTFSAKLIIGRKNKRVWRINS